MADLNIPSYGPHEKQRLYRILDDLVLSKTNLSWSSLAAAISTSRNVNFQRNNFYRLKRGKLQDANIEIIVSWLEKNHQPDIRDRLRPDSIFDEAGLLLRDYFFHISEDNLLEDVDENILQEYEGIYLCAPAGDKSSYLPLSFLRKWYEDRKQFPDIKTKGRSLDIKQYISERSYLILQRTNRYFFYAAEFPMSLLFPEEFETGCIKMCYEGIGIVSSNSIKAELRECLSRVPKTHHILIRKKAAVHRSNPHGLTLHVHPDAFEIKQEWKGISEMDLARLKKEYALSLDSDFYLDGPVQISESPLAFQKNKVDFVFSRDCLYHRRAEKFLRDKEMNFIRPELDTANALEKIIDNPLIIGDVL